MSKQYKSLVSRVREGERHDSWTACLILNKILTHLGNSAGKSGVSEFLVHVDCFSSGQVSENNTVVLEDTGVLLVDLLNRDDLTVDLSDLVLSLHVVPELRLGKHWVLSKHSHSVESGVWVLLTCESSSDDEELSDLQSPKSSEVAECDSLTLACIDSTPTPLTISLLYIMK